METLAIVLFGAVIVALQLCGLRAQRDLSKAILRQNNQIGKLMLQRGVARETNLRTKKLHASTPIVDSNPNERRRSG